MLGDQTVDDHDKANRLEIWPRHSLPGGETMSDKLKPIAKHVACLKKPSFSGPSQVDWTKQKWVESHAAYYTPVFELDKSLPVDAEIVVHVKEDITASSDPTLGKFFVRFPAGQTTGVIRTENDSLAQSRGFPAVTNGQFWLVTTKEERIKGNVGRGDDGHARVYLFAFGTTVFSGNVRYAAIAANKESTRKTVQRRKV
jgi:hypothetical protein